MTINSGADLLERLAAGLIGVDDAMLTGNVLVEPDGGGVVPAQIPERVGGDARCVGHAGYPVLLAQAPVPRLAVVTAWSSNQS
jgi:hypothetical protein